MKSKSKELLYLIGYILVLIMAVNAILVKMYGGITFIPTIAAIICFFVGGYGVYTKTENLIGPKLNKKKKILVVASPFIVLLIWVLIGLLIYQQPQNRNNEPELDISKKELEDSPAPSEEDLLELRAIEVEKRLMEEEQYKVDYEGANKMPKKEQEDLQKKDSI